MRVVFMGSAEFSVPALKLLLSSDDYSVIAVYSKEPKPAGRGYALTKTPVHVCAEDFGIPVRNPKSLNDPGEAGIMSGYNPDVIVVAAYGLMLPKWTFTASRVGCVNIHPSLLPRWRGAAPMQHAILAGDEVTGVSIMQVNERMDAGDVYLQEEVAIGEKENIVDLSGRLAVLGARMLLDVLDNMDKIQPVQQDDTKATYAKKPVDFRIDFSDTAYAICRKIRALYPRVFFMLNGNMVRVLDSDAYYANELSPASVINEKLHIQCGGNTVLVPNIVQQESKKPCDIDSFLRGYRGQWSEMVVR
ncbi:MAG: methionyl-tRNA formyltransferase [Aaplasma endosymbiont of Hyalomma asiaticum]